MPAADRDRLALTPDRADLGRGVAEHGVDRRADDHRSEKPAERRQQRDVERAQAQRGVRRQRPVGDHRDGQRIRQQRAGGTHGAMGRVQRGQSLADLAGCLGERRLQHAGGEPHRKCAGAGIGQQLDARFDGRTRRPGGDAGDGKQAGGEPGRDHDRGVLLADVHLSLRRRQRRRAQLQTARHSRGVKQTARQLAPEVDVLATDGGAGVPVDDRHRQPVQVSGRVDDRAEVHERHHDNQDGHEHQRGHPHRPDLERVGPAPRRAWVRWLGPGHRLTRARWLSGWRTAMRSSRMTDAAGEPDRAGNGARAPPYGGLGSRP